MLSITSVEFEQLVLKGIDALDPTYAQAIRNVAVVVEEYPNVRQRQIAELKPGWTLYGLYEGIPMTQRGENYMFTVPDKISIFRGPILEDASTLEEAQTIVSDTIWHEFGHYFGLNEREVRTRERQRKNSR